MNARLVRFVTSCSCAGSSLGASVLLGLLVLPGCSCDGPSATSDAAVVDAPQDPDAALEVDAADDLDAVLELDAASDPDAASEPDAALGFSSVVRLDGDGDGIELPTNPDYGLVGTSFTIELWFRPETSDVNEYAVLYTRRANYGEYGLNYSLGDTGLVTFDLYIDGATSLAGEVRLDSRTAPAVGVWHHAAGVVDGRDVRLYVDGVLEAEAVAPADITWRPDDPRAILSPEYRTFVGYSRSPGDDGMRYTARFSGDVDDVHVSRVARYAGASFEPPWVAAADADTVGLWTFEEAGGLTVQDSSPAGTLDGTLINAIRVPGGR